MNNPQLSQHVRSFLKQLYAKYNDSISLAVPYNYLHGNPVRSVVPLDVAQDGVMILGAYPTARFATIRGERDVPVGDISGPFSTERYFDGSRIRFVNSGEELVSAYLQPLDLDRNQCWITNLVKVFLFKEGHIKKYRNLGRDWPPRANRDEFEKYTLEGMTWLEQEIQVARPRLIITLGSEVAGVLQNVKGREKRNALLGGDLKDLRIGHRLFPAIHFAHPGIVMRKESSRNQWPKRHREEHIPAARNAIQAIMTG